MFRLVAFRVHTSRSSLTLPVFTLAFLLLLITAQAEPGPQYGSPTACAAMQVGTPAYGSDGGALSGFIPFSSTNAWNTNISGASVDPNSATLAGVWATAGGYNLTPSFGEAPSDGGIPYIVVDSTATSSVPINVIDYALQSDVVIAPLPGEDAVPIEGDESDCSGWPDSRLSNARAIVLDRAACWLYETFNTNRCNGLYDAASETIWDMTGSDSRPWGWTSADASGLSVFAGLARYDEANSGVINHALAFTMSSTAGDSNGGYFVLPASHSKSSNTTANLLPLGARIRLRASTDISSYSTINQAILTAMMNYGLILSDNGSNFNILGDTDANWNDSDLANLSGITSSDFDVIDAPTGATTMTPAYPGMDAVSALIDYPGTVPVINSFTANSDTSAITVSPDTPVTFNFNVTGDSYDYIDNVGPVRLVSGSGTATVTPTATQEYTLYSTNATGRTSSTIQVTVTGSTVSAPVFSPPGGNYVSSTQLNVTLNTATSGVGAVTFYYTTNGATPTTGSTKYTGSIKVQASETLEAIAVVQGYASPSAASTAVYNIGPNTADTPVFNPPAGTYNLIQTVILGDSTNGDGNTGNKIYYTTDGSTPTYPITGSTRQYFSPITVAATETLQAIAVATGYANSVVGSAIYTINITTAATPGFSPPAGSYSSPQSVTISDSTTGAAIYYTTNGSTPTTASTIYTAPFTLGFTSAPTTVNAIAVLYNYNNSTVGTAVYNIPIIPGQLTVPTPDTQTPLTGTSVTFSWTPGNVATHFEFWVGTTGPGSTNLYNSGSVTTTSATVNGLPDNDTTVYARLYSLINGVWQYTDYTYVSAGTATQGVLTTPTPNTLTPLSGTSVTFAWTPSNISTHYDLYAGSTGVGSSNLYNSGNVTATTETVSDLPSNGQTVYVRLYTLINGAWQYTDYTYVAYSLPAPAALTTPTPNTQTPLTGTSVAFAWTPGNIATHFMLYVGSTGVGSSNLYNSGNVTVTTETVSDLPSNGETVYVRLSSLVNATWQSTDYTYVANGSPTQGVLITPAPNTQTPLSGTSVAFSWSPGNTATHFELYVGSTGVGSSNLYNSGSVTSTTETVSDLISNGQTVYARLYSLINGSWKYTDYTYVAYGSPSPAALTTPSPGGTLSGSSVAFSWTPGNTATHFEFYLGSTGVGSSNLYNSGNVTATTETVNSLPVNSEKIYARLYWLIDGAWNHADYTYTAF
jgi:hypothetical protein